MRDMFDDVAEVSSFLESGHKAARMSEATMMVLDSRKGFKESFVEAVELTAFAFDKLREERWQFVRYEEGSTLIEDRVREHGGVVLEAYEETLRTGVFIRALVDGIMGDKQNPLLPSIPRITEQFIDKVVSGAGGRRRCGGARGEKTTAYSRRA